MSATVELTGRELDAAVAERVMGWTNVHYDGPTDRIRYVWMGIPPDGRTYNAEVSYFSTDVAAAMQVVDKMFADGWAVDMGRNIHDVKGPDDWGAGFHGGNNRSGVYVEEYSESLPRAICMAALRVLEKHRAALATVSKD